MHFEDKTKLLSECLFKRWVHFTSNNKRCTFNSIV